MRRRLPRSRLNERAIRCGRRPMRVALQSGPGGTFLPDLGRRLQQNLDLAEYTDVIWVMNGARSFGFASTLRQS